MKKKVIFGLLLGMSFALLLSAGKKDKKKTTAPQIPASPPVVSTCAFSRIVIIPSEVDEPTIMVSSGKEISFQAVAYNASGKEVPANLRWYFRDLPPAEKPNIAGGHKLIGSGSTATLQVSGLASGTFKIAAEASDCLDADGRPIRGVAEIKIYPDPREPARCGPILVMYGEREITNEKLLGFINFILRAEIYGPKNLKGYKIQFYLNGKKVSPKRNLIYDKQMKTEMGQPAGYWNYVPVWLKPGDYSAYYELLKGEKPVCASTNTYFTAR